MSAQQIGVPQRKTLQDTIKDIETQIALIGPGPHTPQQKESLAKLKELHVKALQEQEKIVRTTPSAPLQQQQQQPMVTVTVAQSPQQQQQQQVIAQAIVTQSQPIIQTVPAQSMAVQPMAGVVTPQPGMVNLVAGVVNRQPGGVGVAPQPTMMQTIAAQPTVMQVGSQPAAATPTFLGLTSSTVTTPVVGPPRMALPLVIGAPSAGAAQAPMGAAAAAASSSSHAADNNQILNKHRLQELVREVDPTEQLDDDVEELLLQIADDFIENVVTSACHLAKHRKANTVDVKDVQLHLERNWNIVIPGFGSEEVRPYKKSPTTEAHKQRMALIRKTLKK